MNKAKRNPYFDWLRGIAIIMVVGIHTTTITSPSFESLDEICTIFFRSVLNCAVPIFLAVSGYFIASKKMLWRTEYYSFLKKQIPKIYIPCLIFSLPYFIFELLSGTNSFLKSFGLFFACGFSIYYFIALIIQYYLLLPLFVRFNKLGGVILTAVISTVSILYITYVIRYEGIDLPLLVYAGPFPIWLVFFYMGVYFSEYSRDYKISYPLILVAVGLILQIMEYKYWFDKGHPALGIKISSFVFSAGIIWLLFSRKLENEYKNNLCMRIFNWIGGISFGIYLLHYYIILIVNKLLPQINWVGKWMIVLCLTILVIWISKLIFPKFSTKYLGFR